MSNLALRKAFDRRIGKKQDKQIALPGLLGNGSGLVSVSGRENYVYIRAWDGIQEIFNSRVPPENDIQVWIGYDPVQPDLLQVLSTRSDAPGGANAGYAPASRYEYGGADPIHLDKRQAMWGGYVGRVSGMVIGVWPDYIWSGAEHVLCAYQTLDLTTHIPATTGKAAAVLITWNTSGVAVATKGSEVDFASLTLANCPAAPAGTVKVLAAVRVYYGQTAVQETQTNTDIIDLRDSAYGAGSTIAPGTVPLSALANIAANTVIGNNTGSPATPAAVTIGDLTASSPLAVSATRQVIGGAAAVKLGASAADKYLYSTALDTWAEGVITAAGRALLDDATAGDQKATLGIGGMATSITAGKMLTLAATDNYTLTVPATGTTALLATANAFTIGQSIAGSSDIVQLKVKANATQTANTFEIRSSSNILQLGVNGNGELGLGTGAVAGVIFNAVKTYTDTTGYMYGMKFIPILSPTADGTANLISFALYPTAGQVAYDLSSITGFFIQPSIQHLAGASISNVRGIQVQPDFTVTSAGTVTNSQAIYIPDINKHASSTEALTNQYGIYMDSQTKGTNNYVIYTNAGLARLGDQLSIVGSADRQQLIITGYSTQAVATAMAQITRNDAAAGVSAMLGLTALGSGAAGDGGAIYLRGKSSTTAGQDMARIEYLWTTATHASRTADLIFSTTLAGTLAEKWRMTGSGRLDGMKAGITEEGGFYVVLVAGEDLARGEVVSNSTTTDGRVVKNPTDSDMPWGVVYADATTGNPVKIVTDGIAYVLPESGVMAARGYVIYSSGSEAGRGAQASSVPAALQHWREIGHFIDTGSGNGALTRAIIHQN